MMKKQEVINSVLGEGTLFEGKIKAPSGVHVAGDLSGTLQADGDIFVAESAKVMGDIIGKKVVVSGMVEGNIIAEGGLEITKTGRVKGELVCDKLLIEEGSFYIGKVRVRDTNSKTKEEIFKQEIIVERDGEATEESLFEISKN